MGFAIVAYLAGVLTIISPCILPVLPFVFARAGRPFLTSTLPMLAGMALTFAAVASLAALGGGWAVEANIHGRAIALAALALFGLMLLMPALSARLTAPLVALGGRVSDRAGSGAGGSLLIGMATGFLWAPCAGPVLGLILTGAALHGANAGTTLLLAAYAAGAATALALALGAGGRVYRAMKGVLGAGEGLRRLAGVAVLASVAAIYAGVDTGLLTRLSAAGTNRVEQALIDHLAPEAAPPTAMAPGPAMMAADPGAMMMAADPNAMMSADPNAMMMAANPDAMMMAADPNAMMMGADAGAMMAADPNAMMMAGGAAPDSTAPQPAITPTLAGAVDWLNGPPLTMEGLRGKVVLVDFWTYSCVNCLRTIPYTRAWDEKYRDQGLVVIGVHSPEFAFEKRLDNVRRATADLGIAYPVAIDNDYAIWRAFENRYWPAHYLIDAEGRLRHHQFGEGGHDQTERAIQQLLAEAGGAAVPGDLVAVATEGAALPANFAEIQSPETYIGYLRAANFIGAEGLAPDQPRDYRAEDPRRNEWGLVGNWTAGPEDAALNAGDGALYFRFRARDLNLVLGPGDGAAPVRFRVTIDGQPPGPDHGSDIDADGYGVVDGERLYQLVRQQGAVTDRSFEIRFLDAGVRAYAFTFG